MKVKMAEIYYEGTSFRDVLDYELYDDVEEYNAIVEQTKKWLDSSRRYYKHHRIFRKLIRKLAELLVEGYK